MEREETHIKASQPHKYEILLLCWQRLGSLEPLLRKQAQPWKLQQSLVLVLKQGKMTKWVTKAKEKRECKRGYYLVFIFARMIQKKSWKSTLLLQMMAGNPNWWSMNGMHPQSHQHHHQQLIPNNSANTTYQYSTHPPPLPPQYNLYGGSSSLSSSSLADHHPSQDFPRSWSQLLL